MVNYKHPVNLNAFSAFCQVLYPGEIPQHGDIICAKKGPNHRGQILREKAGFPYGLTLDVFVNTKPINVKLWETENPDPETGELICKGKICGTNEIEVAELALELVFQKVEWLEAQLNMLKEDPELTNEAFEWISEHLKVSDNHWEHELEYDDEPPSHLKMITDFAQLYFLDDLQPESLVAGLQWLVTQEYISKKTPEVVMLWPCMFKLNFQVGFVVDYTRLRDTINDLFCNGFQTDFFVFYCESHNPNCVIHGYCQDSPTNHLYTYRLGAKPKEGYTNVTLISPGFNPQASIQKFWDLVYENYQHISVPELM